MTSNRVNQSGGPSAKKWDFRTIGNNFSEEMYKLNDHRTEICKKFGFMKNITEFTINPDTPHPDERMRDAIDDMINKAFKRTEETMGRKVKMFGVSLTGSGLGYPVYLPYRPYPQNNADVVMEEINKLGQSGGESGDDKRTILLSRPVQMNVTCVALPAGEGPRNVHKFDYGFKEHQRIQVNNNDKFCLFYALAASKNYLELHRPSFHRFMDNNSRQREAALGLLHKSGVNDMENGYGVEHLSTVQKYWDQTFPGKYRIAAFEKSADPRRSIRVIWKGPMGREAVVPIFLENNHWDGLKNYVCFFNRGRNFCIDCECFYDKDVKHTYECKARCYYCNRVGGMPCTKERGVKIECPKCRRYFYNQQCYNYHQGHQTCNIWKRCVECNKTYLFNPKSKHECGEIFCRSCGICHHPKRGCFIKPIVVKEEKDIYRIVVWDSETSQDKTYKGEQKEHVINYISARVTCTECCDDGNRMDCRICGTEREKDWSEAEGHEPTKEFLEWILAAFDKKYKTYLFAHNAGRFDGHFVFNYLCRAGKSPMPLINGLKIYEFTVQNSKKHSMLIWRDSCLLMPVKLETMKATFNLDCEDKPFFPYYYNKKENYNTHLPHLPPMEDYSPGSMKKEKFDKFEKWYNANKETPFYLPEELKNYCQNDTEILLKSIVEFRRILVKDITGGFDPLPRSCTNAGVAMSIFKAMFLQEEELSIVPERGYERCDRASVIAIKYLEWRSKRDNVDIKHAGNGREEQVGKYKLDGYIETGSGRGKCIEVMGCFIHGCLKCYDPTAQLIGGRAAQDLYDDTQERLAELKGTLDNYLPEELKNYCRNDTEILLKSIIEFRRILVKDITGGFDPLPRSCTNAGVAMSIFKAMFLQEEELSIVPERGYERCDRASVIAIKYLEWRSKRDNVDIKHAGNGREEQAKALECGYTVDRFYRAWHYGEDNDDLFKGYVRLFLKLKEESSGFPKGVETEEQKRKWAEEYKEKYGIEIDLEKVKKNPGLRYISKLMLNSLWGKFSMRNSLCKNKVIDQASEFYGLVCDHKIEIHDIVEYSDGAIRVVYKDKEDFITEHSSSNIIISLWTTSMARLKLLEYMQEAERNGGEILYTDTDSIFVMHDRDVEPITTGKYLGQMSEEYGGYEIEEFCCGGAKQYGLKMRNRKTGEVDYVMKIRGITFDVDNHKTLHYEAFKEMVMSYGKEMDPAFFVYKNDFGPTRESKVVTREKHKMYMPISTYKTEFLLKIKNQNYLVVVDGRALAREMIGGTAVVDSVAVACETVGGTVVVDGRALACEMVEGTAVVDSVAVAYETAGGTVVVESLAVAGETVGGTVVVESLAVAGFGPVTAGNGSG
uniref:DNA-directed DNA polymerase n=1 Tax=Globodera pallida TaxID=36090 RepID=A0A183CML4_GLOPA